MEKTKRGILKSYSVLYIEKYGYYGYATINNKEFEIKVKTDYKNTPEEVVPELKKMIVQATMQIEK